MILPGVEGEDMKNKTTAFKVAFIAMAGALSAVLMAINFSLPFAPSFLKMDIAELPALFAGFLMGPAAGFEVVVVKLILKIAFQGTETAFVGELMNLTGSGLFVVTAALIYRKFHSEKGALAAMAVSSVLVSILFIFMNAYVAFPMYSALYGMPLSSIVQMGHAVNPHITDVPTLMLYSVFPFNLAKHFLTAAVTYILYRRTAGVLRNEFWGVSDRRAIS